jgi:hypothetical protein
MSRPSMKCLLLPPVPLLSPLLLSDVRERERDRDFVGRENRPIQGERRFRIPGEIQAV